MRNILAAVRGRDHDQVKQDARKIYYAASLAPRGKESGEGSARTARLLRLPKPLWKKLCTTNAIGRCFVEVRRRTRPMVVFTNVQSLDRVIYAIFESLQ
jgi:transposase-like protein